MLRALTLSGLLVGLAAVFSPLHAADINEARSLFLHGKYEEAIAQADEALAGSLITESWYEIRAQSQFQLGRHADAFKTTQDGLQRLPTSIRLRFAGMQFGPYAGRSDDPRVVATEIATLVQNAQWNYTDVENLVTLGHFILDQGGEPKQAKEAFFDRARSNNPSHRSPILALGNLALDKRDFALAADIFRPAMTLLPNDPDLMFGLARALEGSDPEQMGELVEGTLKENPRHAGALLLKADRLLDGEQYAAALEELAKITAYNPHHPEALAFQSVIATLQSEPDKGKQLRDKALANWTKNPRVDHVIGRELSQKYRFADGAAAQRLALNFDRVYLPARKQLAQDLLRLGQETDGWLLAEQAYKQDQYDVASYNLVTLRSELERFTTIERNGFIIRMDAHEAEVYGDRVVELLTQARAQMSAKYKVDLPQQTLVEIFPKPADFAVRTFGMPGAAGYLGVCFGNVITANSPASQQSSPVNWESVLWHEFTHVVTLNKTHNRMPRWLSEGISVYEERLRDPSWGERMTPVYRDMILKDQLAPVGQISQMFLSPSSPTHLMFAYFESSLVIEHIVDKHGLDALLKVLDDLAVGMHVNEALARHTVPLKQLEEEFDAYARGLAKDYGANVDWSTPNTEALVAADQNAAGIVKWAEENSKNYGALRLAAERLIVVGAMAEAEKVLEQAVALFPLETGSESAWMALARVRQSANNTVGERQALEKLAAIDDDAAAALLRLLEIDLAREDWPAVRKSALKLIAIRPLIPQPHTALARASEQLNDRAEATNALMTLLAMKPPDVADIHYRLAVQLHATKLRKQARRHVLLALEAAPRYRDALALLLQLNREEPMSASVHESPPTVPLPEALTPELPAVPAPRPRPNALPSGTLR